jgi:hypothetical protein
LLGEFLAQTTTNSNIEETYAKLKTQLAQCKCKITVEQSPNSLTTVQGSIWGTSAKTAQKKTTYTLQQTQTGTHITAKSMLTRKYVNFTLAGILLSFVVLFVCVWIAIDLQAYLNTGNPDTWSWLGQSGGETDFDNAFLFARLGWIFATFLALTLLIEGFVLFRLYRNLGESARETLNSLMV